MASTCQSVKALTDNHEQRCPHAWMRGGLDARMHVHLDGWILCD